MRRLLLKSKSLRDFSVFIFGAPNLHGFHDRTHRLPQFRKGIFNPRRDLGINSTGDDPVGLHRAQAVRQHLLADSLQVLFQFIEPPRTHQQVSHDQQLPLAADHLDSGSYRASREFFFAQVCTPSLSQALRMKRLSADGKLDALTISEILSEEKPNQRETIKLPLQRLQKYFPRSYSPKQIENKIFKLLEHEIARQKYRGER